MAKKKVQQEHDNHYVAGQNQPDMERIKAMSRLHESAWGRAWLKRNPKFWSITTHSNKESNNGD